MTPEQLAPLLGRWAAGRGPLYVLLAARLRTLIDDGELPGGALLPPDRMLAAGLAVGRSTVVAAYDLLRQEGKLVRQQGSGTRVAAGLADRSPAAPANPVFLNFLEPPDGVLQFSCAGPSAPPPELAEAYAAALPELAAISGDLGYHLAGHPRLRAAVAAWYTGRGVPTGAEQVLVTTGAQQALALLVRMLLAPNDPVLLETPTYPGTLELLRAAAVRLRCVPVGDDGLDVDAYARTMAACEPALGYVIPTYHNPTGTLLPAPGRRRLVEAAVACGMPLVDDEALAGLDFDADPPPPLAGYAPDGPVISVGSLSKQVWGGLRIGWIRTSPQLVGKLARRKAVADLGGPVLGQLAAALLLPHLAELRRRRRAELRARHDHLCAALRAELPGWRFRPAAGGQTLWVHLPAGDGTSFAQLALRHGVAVLPGAALDPTDASDACLRLPFLHPPEVLTEGVRRLAAAWSRYAPPAAPGARPAVTAVAV
jgi:DNA-binding transcriptional MocR family regulator